MTISGIERWIGIKDITIESINTVADLVPLAALEGLESVRLTVLQGVAVRFHLEPLQALRSLRTVRLECSSRATVDMAELAGANGLSVFVPRSFVVLHERDAGSGCQVISTCASSSGSR